MPPRRSLFSLDQVDHHVICADGYTRGASPDKDGEMERWNRCRCVFCEDPDRTGRCRNCPVKRMKQIILYRHPYLSRPTH